MRRLGKSIHVCDTFGESAYEASNCTSDTTAILISYTGENKMVKEIGKILAERQVSIIGMTSIGENALAKLSDCVLNITTRERLYSKIANLRSIPRFATCDLLYAVVFSNIMRKICSI